MVTDRFRILIDLESGSWGCECEEHNVHDEVTYMVTVMPPAAVTGNKGMTYTLPMKFDRIDLAFYFEKLPEPYLEDIEVVEESLSAALIERLL